MNDRAVVSLHTETPMTDRKTVNINQSTFPLFSLTSLWIGLIVVIPFSGILIGFLFRHECPLERYIPYWEMINGLMTIVFLFFICLTNHPSNDETFLQRLLGHIQHRTWSSFLLDQLKILCIFFLFAWFICGNIWIYRRYSTVQFEKSTDNPFYCHSILYRHAFWYLTVVYLILGVCVFVSCFVTCLRREKH